MDCLNNIFFPIVAFGAAVCVCVIMAGAILWVAGKVMPWDGK
jgi:hypothetical protein